MERNAHRADGGGVYNASVVSGEESAVFSLLMSLDRAWRKLPTEETAQEATANPPVGAELHLAPESA